MKKKTQTRTTKKHDKALRIGIVAPGGPVDMPALAKNLNRIERMAPGAFEFLVHPFVLDQPDFVFSSTDDQRALSLAEYLVDPTVDVIWCARGGYGAIRVLPLLDSLKAMPIQNASRKLLIGYSDMTVLLGYLQKQFGIRTVHGPMPGTGQMSGFNTKKIATLVESLRFGFVKPQKLSVNCILETLPSQSGCVSGVLKGGNLSLLVSTIGTPYRESFNDAILFLEDIQEPFYKIDRLIEQAILAKAWTGVKAVVLGTFVGCSDIPPTSISQKPLRRKISTEAGLAEMAYRISDALECPVFSGLPIGHGKHESGWFEYGKLAKVSWVKGRATLEC